MGFYSYNCKECEHPLLSAYATDPGINEWMTQAVVLTEQGSRFIGEYDGYGDVGGVSLNDIGGACLHEACWEVAGRPEYDRYGSASDSAGDQGYFFNDEHDLIDPRITDEAERAVLLKKGIEARTKARYDQKARDVYEWINDERYDDKQAWESRFSAHPNYADGKPVENEWWVEDRLHGDKEPRVLTGTNADAQAELARTWDEFVKSDEAKALVIRAEEMRDEAKAERLADLKKEGRYESSYGPSKVGGDSVGDWQAGRQMFTVRDNLTFETVAEFDYEGEVKSFTKDPDYRGNNCPEWEARVDENRAESRARKAAADAEAKRLNEQWASDGYPVPEDSI